MLAGVLLHVVETEVPIDPAVDASPRRKGPVQDMDDPLPVLDDFEDVRSFERSPVPGLAAGFRIEGRPVQDDRRTSVAGQALHDLGLELDEGGVGEIEPLGRGAGRFLHRYSSARSAASEDPEYDQDEQGGREDDPDRNDQDLVDIVKLGFEIIRRQGQAEMGRGEEDAAEAADVGEKQEDHVRLPLADDRQEERERDPDEGLVHARQQADEEGRGEEEEIGPEALGRESVERRNRGRPRPPGSA